MKINGDHPAAAVDVVALLEKMAQDPDLREHAADIRMGQLAEQREKRTRIRAKSGLFSALAIGTFILSLAASLRILGIYFR